jgi:hypothetical protein
VKVLLGNGSDSFQRSSVLRARIVCTLSEWSSFAIVIESCSAATSVNGGHDLSDSNIQIWMNASSRIIPSTSILHPTAPTK